MVQAEGDAVKRDEPLLELETDKVTVEVPSPADGAIESISAQAGATVPVGALLGAIAEGAAGRLAPPLRLRRRPKAEAPNPAASAGAGRAKTDVPAMPSAQRIAAETGLATAAVAGTGQDGRVTKGDMLGALASRASAPAPRSAAPAGPRANDAREERVPMTRLRKTIARA